MHSGQNKSVPSLKAERNSNVYQQDLNDERLGAHLSSVEVMFQTDEAKENKRSTSVALLCAGQLVYELEYVCDGRMLATYDGAVLL